MRLPKPIHQRLATEYRFIADSIAATTDMSKKLYFFSAYYSEAARMMNQAWDAELALIHLVTQTAYRELISRVNQTRSGEDNIIGVNEMLPAELTHVCSDLAGLFEDNAVDSGKLLRTLSRIAELSYLTTGNGNYLFLKGHIKI